MPALFSYDFVMKFYSKYQIKHLKLMQFLCTLAMNSHKRDKLIQLNSLVGESGCAVG